MANNGKKGNKTPSKESLDRIIENYPQILNKETTDDDFCHIIYEIIGKLNEEKGAIQIKLPKRDELKERFDSITKGNKSKTLTKDEFRRIVKEIITFDSFTVGKGALDAIAFLFGAPIGALFAKRFIPGGASVSDDILIPAVTSLTVFLLAKTNRL
ncbi:uncharacterized protein LOC121990471 [Zingiber officinale]|uniref:Uncharacterized protein n=1 Tax=Zingiber officinale TaxID=94328 RepID=A0A8J5GC96_ZINOF|nr:uncharacterized protein LOC121990471 [Zingiber officinale]KAG6496862.1 hypothetical protein ZIOFF_044737 [Zingiber officinale]